MQNVLMTIEAVLSIALLFFAWMWGAVVGLLLGAPSLAIAKVVCDYIGSLNPIREALGR